MISRRVFLFLILILPLLLFKSVEACDPAGPVIKGFSIDGHLLVDTIRYGYEPYTMVYSFNGDRIYYGYNTKLCFAKYVGEYKASKRQISVKVGSMVNNCGGKGVYGKVVVCNKDKYDCDYYKSLDSSEGWYTAVDGVGSINQMLDLRCDLPGYCRYRFIARIPTDHEGWCCYSTNNKDSPECLISSPEHIDEIRSWSGGSGAVPFNSFAIYGELLVPGDSVYTSIIPAFKGDLSTNLVPIYVLDKGLDPNANNICTLYGSSNNGDVEVPQQASQCHYTNEEEGPYIVKCGDGKIGKCELTRTISIGNAFYKDTKEFYIYGIDKILVKQSYTDVGDEIIKVSSLDTFSKDLPGLGGFHLFVKYNGDYFDLVQTTNLIKDGGKKVNKVYEITQEYDDPKKDNLPLYASGYTSLEFCKENGFDYVKSYSISSNKVLNTYERFNGVEWEKVSEDYYFFTKIVCGKEKVDYSYIDTYPGTNNLIGYGVHHIQWFTGWGPKILEVRGDPEAIKIFKQYFDMEDVKDFKLIYEGDGVLKYEFEEIDNNSPKYTFKFIEPSKPFFGDFDVFIYPEDFPQFQEHIKLQWLVGYKKSIDGKEILVAPMEGKYYLVPIDYETYETVLGEISNAHPLEVDVLNDVSVVKTDEGTLLSVYSNTDPYFPKYLIPGDDLHVKLSLFKNFGSSNDVNIEVKLYTNDGDLVLSKTFKESLKDGLNKYDLELILPTFTLSQKPYYGKDLKLIVNVNIPNNLEKIGDLEYNLLSMDHVRVTFAMLENGQKIRIIPDPKEKIFDIGDSFTYTFDILKESKRLLNKVKVYFLVKTIDGNIVDSWEKEYPLKEGDNIFVEVYKIPKTDKNGESLEGKDLALIMSLNVPYNEYENTVATYQWIRLKSDFKYYKLGIEAMLPPEDFKIFLDNKFRYNTTEKAMYKASYDNYKIEQYKKQEDTEEIIFYLKVKIPPSQLNEFLEIIKDEPGITYHVDYTNGIVKIEAVWYKRGEDTSNVPFIIDKIRNYLVNHKIYWDESFKVITSNDFKNIIPEIV